MDMSNLCNSCFGDLGDSAACPHCGFSEGMEPESPLYLKPGTVLNNKYMIGRALGQGGFGITYLAWDINLNIKLAIKEYFPQELATRAVGYTEVAPYSASMGKHYDYGLEKFLDEARVLARFEGHPNIVSIRDFFKANGTAYFVMYYVTGTTLKDELKKAGGKMAFEQAINYIIPVLDALREVHRTDILHRDISPDNIFINQKGQVILLDFGAARQAVSEKGRSLSIILKPGYAPEEQYRTKGVQGPWTDIYATAATFYHLITGYQPPEALERMTEDKLVPPSLAGVDLKAEQEQAILKALAVRATDRFQDAGEFQEALLSGVKFKPVTASPEPATFSGDVQETAKSGKQFPRQAVIGAAVLLVSGLVLAGLWGGGVFEGSRDASTAGLDGQLREGTISDDDGTYSGQLLDGLPHGEGIWESSGGAIYEGEWESGEASGYGVMIWPNGDRYEGEWQNDQLHGQGTFYSADGTVYKGGWVNDMRHGSALVSWPSGDSYEGEWRGDLISGEGVFSWHDGRKYEGEFLDNMRNGSGKMIYPDGASYEGDWRNDLKEGFGVFIFPGGERFEGEFSDDLMHGQGAIIYTDGSVIEGRWERGEYQGGS